MRRVLALAFVVVTVSTGCAQLARLRSASTSGGAAKKDCAACEKMCAVAGDAEKNPDAVAACKADCRKSCSE